MTRLTVRERMDRATSGGELQKLVCDLAEMFGWSWAHFRPAMNRRGVWQVPVEGPLATGWPDLFLAQPERRRLLAVEIKRELGDPLTPAQLLVHHVLRAAGLQVEVVRPSDLSEGRVEAMFR